MAEPLTIKTKIADKNIEDTYIKDEDGYYKIRLGRLNAFNRQGVYYRVNDLNKITGENSVFYNRIREGFLRSEVGHPETIKEAMKIKNIQERVRALTRAILFIDQNNVCGHIKEISFVPTGKTEPGFSNEIIEVYGWVKPSGVKKDVLASAFDNPGENTAFSIRSLVRNSFSNGIMIKDVIEISTWDYVYEPGVAGSSKWGGAGIEEMDYGLSNIKMEELEGILDIGLESQCVDGKCLINNLKRNLENNLGKKWLLG